MKEEVNGYSLSREIFDYAFENPDHIRPVHIAIYFFAVEQCNRLGWKEKFGFPSSLVMDAIGMRSYTNYKKALDELIEMGFIKVIQYSKNQHSANIIALSKNIKATVKALDKATVKANVTHPKKHPSKQQEYNKTINNITINKETYRSFAHLSLSFEDFDKLINDGYSKEEVDWILDGIQNYKKNTSYTSLFLTAKKWLKKEKGSGEKEKKSNIQTNTELYHKL